MPIYRYITKRVPEVRKDEDGYTHSAKKDLTVYDRRQNASETRNNGGNLSAQAHHLQPMCKDGLKKNMLLAAGGHCSDRQRSAIELRPRNHRPPYMLSISWPVE